MNSCFSNSLFMIVSDAKIDSREEAAMRIRLSCFLHHRTLSLSLDFVNIRS